MESPDKEVPLYLNTDVSLVWRVQIERFHFLRRQQLDQLTMHQTSLEYGVGKDLHVSPGEFGMDSAIWPQGSFGQNGDGKGIEGKYLLGLLVSSS